MEETSSGNKAHQTFNAEKVLMNPTETFLLLRKKPISNLNPQRMRSPHNYFPRNPHHLSQQHTWIVNVLYQVEGQSHIKHTIPKRKKTPVSTYKIFDGFRVDEVGSPNVRGMPHKQVNIHVTLWPIPTTHVKGQQVSLHRNKRYPRTARDKAHARY